MSEEKPIRFRSWVDPEWNVADDDMRRRDERIAELERQLAAAKRTRRPAMIKRTSPEQERAFNLVAQMLTIEADEYNQLVADIKAAKANERAARAEGFRAGVRAMRDTLLADAVRLNQGVAERLIRDVALPEPPKE